MGENVSVECLAQNILAAAVRVHLELRIYTHDVTHEIEIAERHACFERIYGNASVRTQNVVHMQLAYALYRFCLKSFGRGREVRVFVSEQFVGNFAGQKHLDVGRFAYFLADKVHSHARADSRYVKRPERFYDRLETVEHFLSRHEYFGVIASDIVRDLSCVFKIDCVLVHTHGKRANG